ncbi:hypothetical protein ACHRVW_16125 [Flavobacterium collinsii]|uniref:Uncharacterized protein n=1 Tax=Flavobacterium collinsii TaxID=1114861 RepID=A0A9W4TF32_9FLAO|nr:hypothetical protein [Flavobacterium collinsii]CAA9197830.1 hypothetical protein FLACOL7796_01888 [Flavobacterium collinsii]CAI2766908.1 conserved protein of unknown function [Flavobacterium collinsii]
METEKETFLKEDEKNIFYEQKQALKNIFEKLDMSKIAFVGGIADYINLRSYYDMPINDIDIIYQDEEDLLPIKENDGITRYFTRFYDLEVEVLVSEFKIDNKEVHADFFKRVFSKIRLVQSPLLGTMVWHATFNEMKAFHNNQIPLITSEAMGQKYEWKRLYKHSKKASLYNNVCYLEEKQKFQTLNDTLWKNQE